jgi:hypothetical protein
MSAGSEAVLPKIDPEEIQNRMDEYRRLGSEWRSEAQVVYQEPDHPCPWPGCDARIAGINFQLKKMADSELSERLLTAWWQGPGLVGSCPRCKHYVLYGLQKKRSVPDPQRMASALLPDDWHARAHLVVK